MDPRDTAAYGGAGWSPRRTALHEELGSVWSPCGVDSEWAPLRAVLLHRPGSELESVSTPNESLMLATPDAARAGREHDELARIYREQGVAVHYVEPAALPAPNQMFVADLMVMTPCGAIVGRPASTVRAGEERWVARRLADLGIPILRSVGGHGTFEGADALWLDGGTVVLGVGLRTNLEGATQVAATLRELGVEALIVDSPIGTMHLMGQLRLADRDLAIAWHGRVAWRAVDALRDRGYRVLFFPSMEEAHGGFAHNFVTLGPCRILMPAGNPRTQRFYEEAGIRCVTVEVTELQKAAGGVGCLTGILWRDLVTSGRAPGGPLTRLKWAPT